MSRLRTFIGVPVEKGIRTRLVDLQETLAEAAPDVKWVEAENLHVTLLNKLGVPVESVGDSTGQLELDTLTGV